MNPSEFVHNFERALARLEEFTSLPIRDERDHTAIVKAFEYTFEQAWKSVQKYAQAQSAECYGPKDSIRKGIELGIIPPGREEAWIRILKDRNLTSHVYHEELSHEVSTRIISAHVHELHELLSSLTHALQRQ